MSLAPTTTTTTSSNRRRALAARRGSAAIAVAAIGIAATAGAAHGAFSRTRTSAVNTIAAASMDRGATPTAKVSGGVVTISWTAAKYTNGTEVESAKYTVRRHPENLATETIICASPIAALTCTDSPGAGQWRYTVTPIRGSWTGPTSNRSAVAEIVTDTVAPAGAVIDSLPVNGTSSDGKPNIGDKIVYTFSERMSPGSIRAGWNGTETGVTVRFADASDADE